MTLYALNIGIFKEIIYSLVIWFCKKKKIWYISFTMNSSTSTGALAKRAGVVRIRKVDIQVRLEFY